MTLTPTHAPTPVLPPTRGFLWGAATSAHQTEGRNSNSNWWHLEQSPHSPFSEPSGDAVDSYHRYPTDMRLLAEAGLTAYRFSIEWARIEPSPGAFDDRELQHYRDMIVTAQDFGLTPVVTLHHFTNPMWFTQQGGWRGADAITHFTRYVARAAEILEDVEWVCTINEPNMVALAANLFSGPPKVSSDSPSVVQDNRAVSAFALPEPADDVSLVLEEAHRGAVGTLRARTDAKLGWTVGCQVFEAAQEHNDVLTRIRWAWTDRYLTVSREDDFVGVQAYTAHEVGAAGMLPHPEDPSNTLAGWPNRPDALEIAVRHAWDVTEQTPVLVTENGIATDDDSERVAFTKAALEGLGRAMEDGVDVRGYLHWSLLDNYEWGDWTPTFGLIEVDRTTFERIPRPSLAWLGETALRHASRDVAVPHPTLSAEDASAPA